MSRVIDEHRVYVGDPHKLSAYERALREVMPPGAVVLDLGAGTGLLGLLACRSGASRVYAIDATGIIELARQLAVENGFGERIVHVRGLSTRIELPEKADLVVADQIGVFGVEAGVIEYFVDAQRRLLAPNAVLVPNELRLFAVPVEHSEAHGEVAFWEKPHAGLSWKAALEIAQNTIYRWKLQPDQLLGAPQEAMRLPLGATSPTPFRGKTDLTVQRDGVLHGIGVFWEAQLSPSVVLTNSPLSATRIDRRDAFLPLPAPVAVRAGDRVAVDLTVDPTQVMITWRVSVRSPGATEARAHVVRSTFRGMLVSQDDLRRTHPDYVPRLDRWGLARKTVLDLCDGKRTLAQIEQQVLQSHPELFSRREQAAAFAAEVITRYAV